MSPKDNNPKAELLMILMRINEFAEKGYRLADLVLVHHPDLRDMLDERILSESGFNSIRLISKQEDNDTFGWVVRRKEN
jgi:hypothetical protein